MNRRGWNKLFATALLWLSACQTPAVQPTQAAKEHVSPAMPPPRLADAAHNRIQDWLIVHISDMPDASFLESGITSAEVPRAKTCVVQAMIADIPDAEAEHVADMLERDPPLKDAAVEKWILQGLDETGDRREQVNAQVRKLCPQFARSFGIP